ncbi:protein FAM183A [Astyanax mexicanus]|uniref:Protein FAM183A n=1 Tax=Astyanax mexicanus TaxID=7994 RepID=A0A8B9RHT3_ASTMX|nr:protein FAM183A [Astyanax mexicanus]
MSAPGKTKEIEPVDIVHQNAIFVERIRKEQRSQKLHTEFSINPKKLHILTDKPMSRITHEPTKEDPAFLKLIKAAHSEPTKKYTHPMTESQEIGWISTPLIVSDRSDGRLNFARKKTDITQYMNAAFHLKEQTQNLR